MIAKRQGQGIARTGYGNKKEKLIIKVGYGPKLDF